MLRIFLLVIVLALPLRADAAATSVPLLLGNAEAKPGSTVMAGLHLKMDPHWHTYWRNPGESGEPTRVTWELPAGITAGDIQWPVPEKLEWVGLITYG